MNNKILYPRNPVKRLLLLSRAVLVAEGEGEAIGLDPLIRSRLAEGTAAYQALLERQRLAKSGFHSWVARRKEREDQLADFLWVGWAHCKSLVLVGRLSPDLPARFGLNHYRIPQGNTSQTLLAEARKLAALLRAMEAEGLPGPVAMTTDQLESSIFTLEQTCQATDQAALQLNGVRADLRRGNRRADHLIRLLTLSLRQLFDGRPDPVVRETMRRFGFRFAQRPGEEDRPVGPTEGPGEDPFTLEEVTAEELTPT